jgi:plastocyanin
VEVCVDPLRREEARGRWHGLALGGALVGAGVAIGAALVLLLLHLFFPRVFRLPFREVVVEGPPATGGAPPTRGCAAPFSRIEPISVTPAISPNEAAEATDHAAAAPPLSPVPAGGERPQAAPPRGEPPPPPAGQPVGLVNDGAVIRGSVYFTGAPPPRPLLNRSSDPYCAKTAMRDESVIVNGNGTLENVLVRVVAGLPARSPEALAQAVARLPHAVVEQRDCMYRPRLQVVWDGQEIDIRNADQTTHNIHTYRSATTLFNQAQIAGSSPILKTTKSAPAIWKLKCDIHPWMIGHLAFTDHPYYAITDETGHYALPPLPPGDYTVEAWHERYGVKRAAVTVGSAPLPELSYSYDGSEAH